jgi:hypothetical protein
MLGSVWEDGVFIVVSVIPVLVAISKEAGAYYLYADVSHELNNFYKE